MLLKLGKTGFDDPAALFPLRPGLRLLQFLSHGLHYIVMRPDFNLPPFGVAGALRPDRAIAMMTAKTLDELSAFGGAAFVIQ